MDWVIKGLLLTLILLGILNLILAFYGEMPLATIPISIFSIVMPIIMYFLILKDNKPPPVGRKDE